jgi:hypothetical protein
MASSVQCLVLLRQEGYRLSHIGRRSLLSMDGLEIGSSCICILVAMTIEIGNRFNDDFWLED